MLTLKVEVICSSKILATTTKPHNFKNQNTTVFYYTSLLDTNNWGWATFQIVTVSTQIPAQFSVTDITNFN